MKVVFVWHNMASADPVSHEMEQVPRHEELVYLTFKVGTPNHGFRVLHVRWYPMGDPPYAQVHVVQR